MKVHAEATIHASPDTIWALLTNGQTWTDWDTSTVRLEGDIAEGETLTVFKKADPKRAFKPKVVSIDRDTGQMVWSGGMPLGLFVGRRTFAISPAGDLTHVSIEEEFSGLLLPMMKKVMPDLQPFIEEQVAALKTGAEAAPPPEA